MPGPSPKAAALRQRRNQSATKSTLPSETEASARSVPELPDRQDATKWHPKVIEWWASVWTSPMAVEFTDADRRGGLLLLADLYQYRWTAVSPTALLEVASEIRLQERRHGLDAMARRALQWEIPKDDGSKNPTSAAKTGRKGARTKPAKDPRSVLKVV